MTSLLMIMVSKKSSFELLDFQKLITELILKPQLVSYIYYLVQFKEKSV